MNAKVTRNLSALGAYAATATLALVVLVYTHQIRSEAENSHRDSEQIRAAIDSSDVAIVIVSPRGAIMTWSHGAEKLFGLPRGRAVGQPVSMLIPPEYASRHRVAFDASMRGDQYPHSFRAECIARRYDANGQVTTFPAVIQTWVVPEKWALAIIIDKEATPEVRMAN